MDKKYKIIAYNLKTNEKETLNETFSSIEEAEYCMAELSLFQDTKNCIVQIKEVDDASIKN